MADTELVAAMWVIFHDKDFVRSNHAQLDPYVMPHGAARYLTSLVSDLWGSSKSLLTPDALNLFGDEGAAREHGTTLDEAVDLYVRIYDRHSEQDAGLLRGVAQRWFRALRLSAKIDDAQTAIANRDLEAADAALNESHRIITPSERGLRLFDFKRARSIPVKQSMPTGIAPIDKFWLGGLHLGQTGMVIAPWNTGKSMILPWFAAQAIRANKRVLYYTTEVPEDVILARMVSGVVRQPINGMDIEAASRKMEAILRQREQLAGSEEGDALASFFEVRYRDAMTLSIPDIEADLDELSEEGNRIHLVICDGDDLRAPRKYDRAYDMFLQIYTDLTALAQRRGVAIWTAAQAQREAKTLNRVSGQHVADSVAKIRKVDLALGLQMKAKWLDDDMDHFMQITVAKDRYYGTLGKTFRVKVHFGFGTDGYAAFDGGTEVEDKEKEEDK